jgi:hypothetical protein
MTVYCLRSTAPIGLYMDCENMQCKRGFLPWVFKLAELIFLKLTIYLKQAIASLIKLPFLSFYQTH